MTNPILQEIKYKLFRSGNPVFSFIGINVLVFVVVSLAGVLAFFAGYEGYIDQLVGKYFAFPTASDLWLSRFYTIITYQFFHDGFFHILFNMLWLYWMGQIFMDFLKPRQFYFVYLGGGVLGAVFAALIYHTVPVFAAQAQGITMVGSSAAVMSIFAATVTLVPDYHIRLLLIGNVKIKYLLLVFILLDLMGTTSTNAGGNLAHLGGIFFGFAYVKILRSGIDISKFFKKKTKLKVVRNEAPIKNANTVNQKEIDAILDKISKTGYDKLSKAEKDTLFKASKNQ